ncbi:MAG: hypothetical protein J7L38_08255 [Thermoproteales archaeon]|nr:hypothetical protein [Thermoproteales archaeon]
MPRRSTPMPKNRKGTFSVEAAIILISFAVIASALAFVVINMGFFAAQKTKSTMETGIQEASSALELDGSILAYVEQNSSDVPKVKYIIIPVKTSVARASIDFSANNFIISVTLKDKVLVNVYNGTLSSIPDKLDGSVLDQIFTNAGTSGCGAYAVILNGDGDSVLELNEKAIIIIRLVEQVGTSFEPIGPGSYENIKIEFKSGEGATLRIIRQIMPSLPDQGFIDLG